MNVNKKNGPPNLERRRSPLSPAQFEAIAERAKELVMAEIFISIGKGVLQRFLVTLIIGFICYGAGAGWLKRIVTLQ